MRNEEKGFPSTSTVSLLLEQKTFGTKEKEGQGEKEEEVEKGEMKMEKPTAQGEISTSFPCSLSL